MEGLVEVCAHVFEERHLFVGHPGCKPDLQARIEGRRCRRKKRAGPGVSDNDRGLEAAEGVDEDPGEVPGMKRGVVRKIDCVHLRTGFPNDFGKAIPA
jgi:hypothetical protein